MAIAEPDAPPTADPSGAAPLRLGLLVDSLTQPAWVERALRRIIESGDGEFVVIVRNDATDPSGIRPSSRLSSWWRNRRQLLYSAYQRLDRRRLRGATDPFAPVDVAPLLKGVPILGAVPVMTKVTDTIETPDLERIRAFRPDVLIRLGFRILRGGILTAAPHGVWSYHHGDNDRYRGGPPGFWEVMEGTPVTGTILQRLTEALDDGPVLYRSWGATNLFSVSRGRAEACWKGSEFLARALRMLRAGTLSCPQREMGAAPYGYRLYVAPSNREMAAGVMRISSRRLREKWRSVTSYDQWFMAYRRRSGLPDENREPDLAPFRFRPIIPPRDRFWADPFPMRVGGGEYVLFEDYPYATRRGVISAMELGPEGPVGSPQVVLSRDYHLSYPFVFSWRGEQFMVPETADAGRVELYRATRAPMDWTLEAMLMADLPLADCTLAEIGGKWWMFANAAVPGASYWDELHVFHAPSPMGPWTPHRRNPVVSDVRTARPAGGLFQRGGVWYRPSQDCSRGYGCAMNIQRIGRLDESTYEEETVGRLLPEWAPGLTGTHTVNALGGLTVIDARRRASKAPWGSSG